MEGVDTQGNPTPHQLRFTGGDAGVQDQHQTMEDMEPEDIMLAAEERQLQDLLSAVHFQKRTRAETMVTAPSSQPSSRTSRYRIVVVADSQGQQSGTPLKQLTNLLTNGLQHDASFGILRWRKEGTGDAITSVRTMSYAQKELRTYLHTRQSSIVTMAGEYHLSSACAPEEMVSVLASWGKSNGFIVFMSPCQAEEVDKIGMLIQGTKHINPTQLKAAVMKTPLWLKHGGFEFGFTMAPFSGGKDESTRCLMVLADRNKTAEALTSLHSTI